METVAQRETVKTITTHYIDGAFVESHGREVMDIIKPTNGQVIDAANHLPGRSWTLSNRPTGK